ncbi:hypothetical protein K4I79_005930, partial [Candida tropicalis]
MLQSVVSLKQVHLENSSSNKLRKRDLIDDFIASIEDTEGTPIEVTISAGIVGETTSSSVVPAESTIGESSSVVPTESSIGESSSIPAESSSAAPVE